MSNSSFTLLENSGILGVTGRDAIQFLQGYITNDAQHLSSEIWQPGAFCNLQGRMVANFRMVNQSGQLLIKMDRQLVDVVQQFLQKYIVFSKAETLNMTDSYCQVGIAGEAGATVLKDIFGNLPEGHQTCSVHDDHIIILLPGESHRYELWLQSGTSATTDTLETLGKHLIPVDEQAWCLKEIQSGWAWITADTSEQFIPQMMNLQAQDAISFEKGCYLGQEIVARMQYLGQLKRRMHRYRVVADNPPGVGDKILTSDDKVNGEIVCWASEYADPPADVYEMLAVVRDTEADSLHLESGAQLELMPLPYTCAV
jgi:folate-binding protein YgfZ